MSCGKGSSCAELSERQACCTAGSTHYAVFPGVDLYIHNIRSREEMTDCSGSDGEITVHFCAAGTFQLIRGSGHGVLLQDGGISIGRRRKDHIQYVLMAERYEGIEIRIAPEEAEQWCGSQMPAFSIPFSKIIDSTLGSCPVRFGKASLECEHILRELFTANSHRSLIWTQLKVLELFLTLQDGIIEQQQEYIPSDRSELAKHIRDHIIGLETEEFSLERIAEEHGLSVSQVQRIFKAVFGCSVYQYYKQYRLDEAANRLQNTDDCIEEIAYSAGYHSVSKFTAAFKNRFGTTPLSFRRRSLMREMG